MSFVPFTTQFGPLNTTQCSQGSMAAFILVHSDKMSERQSTLMIECQRHLDRSIPTQIVSLSQLEQVPTFFRLFVIPFKKDNIVVKIKKRFEKSQIYLPKAIIEARAHYNVPLPVRSLTVSLTMHDCRIFLVKNCDQPNIRNRINEMGGTVVTSFSDPHLNVVLTDRADDRYCSKAFHQNVPVVSPEWIETFYNKACDDLEVANRALPIPNAFRVKPFYGLHFKIMVQNPSQLKNLILANQGNIIYGNESSMTHIVVPNCPETENEDATAKDPKKPKIVDVEFISTCAQYGYYLTKREYREYRTRLMLNASNIIKQEPMPSQEPMEHDQIQMRARTEENLQPMISQNGFIKSFNDRMLPPPQQVARPTRLQSDNMNDMILKALSDSQTQHASTQMRRLPDPELRIEQSFEPSQQLYWNDSVSRRN